MANPLLDALGIRHPIIQAPMAGGMVTPALVAAVSEAGALGSFAAAVLTPDAMRDGVSEIRRLTSAPFNVNLFVLPNPEPDRAAIERSHKLLRKLRDELGIERDPEPNRYAVDNREQIEALIELDVPVASFTFGLLDADIIARLRARGTFVMGTATNLREAEAWVANGADAVCAQGAEAGGHRGTFIGDMAEGAIGTMALVPQIAAGIEKPVVAAGGIMNGRGIAAALALGADAAQLGTAFLNCAEAQLAPPYLRAIREAQAHSTRLTRAFSGRYARGIVNRFMQEMQPYEEELPPYPVQNALTADIRAASAKAGSPDYMSLWAGQGVGLTHSRPEAQPAAELVAALLAEFEQTISALSNRISI